MSTVVQPQIFMLTSYDIGVGMKSKFKTHACLAVQPMVTWCDLPFAPILIVSSDAHKRISQAIQANQHAYDIQTTREFHDMGSLLLLFERQTTYFGLVISLDSFLFQETVSLKKYFPRSTHTLPLQAHFAFIAIAFLFKFCICWQIHVHRYGWLVNYPPPSRNSATVPFHFFVNYTI